MHFFGRHPALKRENVFNMVFLFEEPTEEYVSQNSNSALTKLGTYNEFCLKRMECVHVVFPSVAQFYMLERGTAAHHQDMWIAFSEQICILCQYKVPLWLYSPERSHSGGFLSLLNQDDADFANEIDWDALKTLQSAAKAIGDNRHRACTSRDYGFCGSQNSSAEHSPTGIPAPRMKEGTTHEAVRNTFATVS